MRRYILAATALIALQNHAMAQTESAPVFRAIDPAMKTTKTITPVAPAAAPAPVAAPAAAPAAAAPATPAHTLTAPENATLAAPAATLPAPVSRSGEVIDSTGSGAIPAIALEVVTENYISYINGGIGDEEVAQIEAQENNFNLRIQIVGLASAEFVSDVKLTLKDAKGNAITVVNDAGPYVYFRVPVGSYIVDVATAAGAMKTLSVKIPENSAIKTIFRM